MSLRRQIPWFYFRDNLRILLVFALLFPAIVSIPVTSSALSPTTSTVTDLTLFVCADLHFGFPGINIKNDSQIAAMNALPGKPYPGDLLSGIMSVPDAVWIPGDVTENGSSSDWGAFVARYGLTGTDGDLRYPVYEGYGNHDIRLNRTIVQNGIVSRHGSLHYSMDRGRVHLANCNLYPGDTAQAMNSLSWLKNDLAVNVGESGKAVVIFLHYSLEPGDLWWSAAQKTAFARAIAGYNVVAICHGHVHDTAHYQWNGYDVYKVGAVKDNLSESFAVVHITDTRLEAANYRWTPGDTTGQGRWEGWTHSKVITTRPLPETRVLEWASYR